jgi:hypothetical protein
MKPCRIEYEAREKNPILLSMGFTEVRWAVYVHPSFDIEFDFSDTPPTATILRLGHLFVNEGMKYI